MCQSLLLLHPRLENGGGGRVELQPTTYLSSGLPLPLCPSFPIPKWGEEEEEAVEVGGWSWIPPVHLLLVVTPAVSLIGVLALCGTSPPNLGKC